MFKSFLFVFLLGFTFSSMAVALPLPKTGVLGFVQIPQTFTDNYDFEGILGLSNCSGSLIRLQNSKDSDAGLVLTNGHCLESGFSDAGKFVVNQASHRSFNVLNSRAQVIGQVSANLVLYSTMTRTDITIYRLQQTYADIKAKFNVRPLTLASTHPSMNDPIEVISGYWKKGYSCSIETFSPQLREDQWTFVDSLRYSRPGCETIGGTSGSPILLAGSRTVIGINNTGNEDGEECTMNNPCEVDSNGKVFYQQGYSYGQQTYWIYSCLDSNNQINVQTPGCQLPH